MDGNVNCLTKMKKLLLHEILGNRSVTVGVNGQVATAAVDCEAIPFFSRKFHIHWTGQLSRLTSLFCGKSQIYVQNYSLNRMIAFLYCIAYYPCRASNSWCPAHIWSRSIREVWMAVHAYLFHSHWLHVWNVAQRAEQSAIAHSQKSDICIWNMLFNGEKKLVRCTDVLCSRTLYPLLLLHSLSVDVERCDPTSKSEEKWLSFNRAIHFKRYMECGRIVEIQPFGWYSFVAFGYRVAWLIHSTLVCVRACVVPFFENNR